MKEEYKDPKDLRDIPLERLKQEGQRAGHQFGNWNDLFNIESAMRIATGMRGEPGYGKFSEIERWSIFSNRYLLMEREHLTDYKLFTKDEVLYMIQMAFNEGWQAGAYSKEDGTSQHEASSEYMKQKQNI
jgi:hypothetical protein